MLTDKLNYLFLLAMATLMLSCSKGDDEEPEADYQVLGITSIRINGERIPVKNNCLLDLSNTPFITMDGIEKRQAQKQLELSYAVATELAASLSIHAESCSDASVVVTKELVDGRYRYKVEVSRQGYKERLTYMFNCFPVKEQTQV